MSRSEAFGAGGVTLRHDKINVLPWHQPQDVVTARLGGQEVGHVRWATEGEHAGRVVYITVHPDHQRKGIASALFQHAKSVDPRVHHAHDNQTLEGRAWAQKVGD